MSSFVFFANKPKVGPYELNPLTSGRLITLEMRGNVLACEPGAGKDDPFSVHETLLVASAAGEDLADWSQLADDDWQRKVRAFAMEVSQEDYLAFYNLIKKQIAEIKAAQAVPVKKRAARRIKK